MNAWNTACVDLDFSQLKQSSTVVSCASMAICDELLVSSKLARDMTYLAVPIDGEFVGLGGSAIIDHGCSHEICSSLACRVGGSGRDSE